MRGVQNQTLGQLDADIVLRWGSEQVLGGFGQQKKGLGGMGLGGSAARRGLV